MRATIIPEDQLVIVDGNPIGLTFTIDPTIHAIQWDGANGVIERKVGGAEPFIDISVIKPYLDAWQAAHTASLPPPLTPEELAVTQARNAAKAARALADIQAHEDAKINAVVQYFITHTVDECRLKVAADVTNLATAVTMLQHFAAALCVLARREFKE